MHSILATATRRQKRKTKIHYDVFHKYVPTLCQMNKKMNKWLIKPWGFMPWPHTKMGSCPNPGKRNTHHTFSCSTCKKMSQCHLHEKRMYFFFFGAHETKGDPSDAEVTNCHSQHILGFLCLLYVSTMRKSLGEG